MGRLMRSGTARTVAIVVVVLLAGIILVVWHHTPASPKRSAATAAASQPSSSLPSVSSPSPSGVSTATTAPDTERTVSQPLFNNVLTAVAAYYHVWVTTSGGKKQVMYGYRHMPSFTLHPEAIPPLQGLNAQGLTFIKDSCLEIKAVASDVKAYAVPGQPTQLQVLGIAQTSYYYGTRQCTLVDGTVVDGTPYTPPNGADPFTLNPFSSIWQQSATGWRLVSFHDGKV